MWEKGSHHFTPTLCTVTCNELSILPTFRKSDRTWYSVEASAKTTYTPIKYVKKFKYLVFNEHALHF